MNRRSFLSALALLPGLGWLKIYAAPVRLPIYTLPAGYDEGFAGEGIVVNMAQEYGWLRMDEDAICLKRADGSIVVMDRQQLQPIPTERYGARIIFRCQS